MTDRLQRTGLFTSPGATLPAPSPAREQQEGTAAWRPGARIRLDVAYVGTRFHGWQAQLGLRTVQGELARMLGRLIGREIHPIGAGRTDAGVHARGQVCHVSVRNAAEAERLLRRLPKLAPEDLQVLRARPVSPAFNARFSATARRYSYRLLLQRDVFREPFAAHVPYSLDREAAAGAAALLLGTHDFTSYCKKSSVRETGHGSECVVDLCYFVWGEDEAIFHIRANRFLHHMVRGIVGTLLEVGRGRLEPADIPRILAARDRSAAGRNMVAKGLCLEEVSYPRELLDPDYGQPAETDHVSARNNHEGESA
jgi:tRNA pseudouridine38-40 synthase